MNRCEFFFVVFVVVGVVVFFFGVVYVVEMVDYMFGLIEDYLVSGKIVFVDYVVLWCLICVC